MSGAPSSRHLVALRARIQQGTTPVVGLIDLRAPNRAANYGGYGSICPQFERSRVRWISTALCDTVKLKFLEAPLTSDQLKLFVKIPAKRDCSEARRETVPALTGFSATLIG